MVAGGVPPVAIRCMVHIVGNGLMFSCFIDMAVKRPHRPVANGAENEPYHEKAFEHAESLQQID